MEAETAAPRIDCAEPNKEMLLAADRANEFARRLVADGGDALNHGERQELADFVAGVFGEMLVHHQQNSSLQSLVQQIESLRGVVEEKTLATKLGISDASELATESMGLRAKIAELERILLDERTTAIGHIMVMQGENERLSNQMAALLAKASGSNGPVALARPVEVTEVMPQATRIVAAAIRDKGIVYTGVHHDGIFRQIVCTTGTQPTKAEPGFVADNGKFYDCREAARIALMSRQIMALPYGDVLFSEWLWT